MVNREFIETLWQTSTVFERLLLVTMFVVGSVCVTVGAVIVFLWTMVEAPIYILYAIAFVFLVGFAYMMADDYLGEY